MPERRPVERNGDMVALVDQLRQRGRQVGLAAVGVAPGGPMKATRRVLEDRKAAGLAAGMQFTYRNPARSTDPGRSLPGARALVVGAWAYLVPEMGASGRGPAGASVAVPLRPGGGPLGAPVVSSPGSGEVAPAGGGRPAGRVARYAWRDYYGDLRRALGELARVLERQGWAARALADDNALVDRAAAALGGLGWFGKNANILLPGRGSWFVLGSVVTDAPLPPDPPVEDGCGHCRRCLGACPTGALAAPGVLDARRCLAWLLQSEGVFPFEFREALGDRIYGCDDCQEACPVNRHAPLSGRHDGAPPGWPALGEDAAEGGGPAEGPSADILEILELRDSELLSKYGRWYIPRRDPRYLRRNALVVLGNSGAGRAPEAERLLLRYLRSEDELLRAHAVWAAARLGRKDLLERCPNLSDGTSQLVSAELERLPEVCARAGA